MTTIPAYIRRELDSRFPAADGVALARKRHDPTLPPGKVYCTCGHCSGWVRDGGPEEEALWARVFAERGIADPTLETEQE